MSNPISDAIAEAAAHVPRDLLIAAADAIATMQRWSTYAEAKLVDASPAPLYRPHAERVARAWADEPETPGLAVAVGLRSAAQAVDASREAGHVSLVWTGPTTHAVGLRSTRAVVHSIVDNATENLVLVSFASYRVHELVTRLEHATERGVDVALVLESQEGSGGALTVDAANAFSTLRGKARFYHWPIDARRAYFAESARLHAKCIIADRSVALITSANLTSAGINDNIELGTLIEAGPLPALLQQHFELLIQAETLQRVD